MCQILILFLLRNYFTAVPSGVFIVLQNAIETGILTVYGAIAGETGKGHSRFN